MNLEKQCLENSEYKNQGDKIVLKNAINLENVSFSYNNKNFLMKNLNLKITAGKTTAIVGPSGAGKSTIADIVMGLIQPNEGKIKVDNVLFHKCYGFLEKIKLDM